MKHILSLAVTIAIALGSGAAAQSGHELFQQALAKERAEGKLQEAIAIYQRITKSSSGDRALVAKALLRLADCYQKLGDAEARNVYDRLVREFADQTDAVAEAKSRLAGLPASSPVASGLAARQVWTGVDVGLGSPSPDGRYLSHQVGETGDLAVRDLRSGTSRRLTNTGGWEASGDYVDSSVISPDGRQIAYNWFVDKDFKNELRVLPVSATETTRPRVVLRTDRNDYLVPLALTPDSTQLVVIRTWPDQNNQIGTVSVQTGSFRGVKSLEWRYPNRASLSPDGHYLAYDVPAGRQGSPRDIFVLAMDGSGESAVVQGPANDSSPLWSPDGARILFLSDRTGSDGLWTIPVERSKPTGTAILVKPDLGPARPIGMTRDGTLFYGIPGSTRTNVYVANLDAMTAKGAPVLAAEQFLNSNVGPMWSPDGQAIAYYSHRSGRNSPPTVVIRSTKTDEERSITARIPLFSPFFAGPQWFPDGRSLLVISRAAQGSGLDFYRLHLESGNVDLLHHITGGSSSVALSPDGRAIFYAVQGIDGRPSSGRLVRVDIDGGRETVLKQDEWFIAVRVSPDGKQLAYLKSLGNGTSVIETMPAGGGESREIYYGKGWGDGSRYNTLAWTPDQRFVLFVRAGIPANSPSVVWRVPASGGDAEKVGISMAGRIKNLAVRPDSGQLLFSAIGGSGAEIWTLENVFKAPSVAKQTGQK